MSDERTPPEDDRTVFRPLPGTPPAPEPEATRISAAPPSPPPGQTVAPGGTAMPTFAPMAPRTGEAHIQVGDVLNHIFEVKRFIARGGMGEVFEGCNVNSDERVAIKVILPQLAADPNVQAMFRKEAKTLTRLSHPALVQYRVLAQEPQLGCLYIVTEFVDGVNLCDVLGKVQASPAELIALTRRLADGLRTAHALGAIHRDISPDNVLLEHGRLDQARIIDFGIAKDLDPGAKTIIGDGFAGKLGYVAPEQLGDFDRQVGPWSDVYSLGLVILAVAQGRNVDIGGSFVDAIDKRRKGPDLSAAPPEIRPVLEKMLKANPAERLRSMDEVIAALDAAERPVAAPPPAPSSPPATPRPTAPAEEGGSKGKLLIGAGAGLALLLAGGTYLAFGGSDEAAPPPTASAPADPAAPAVPGAEEQVATARAAVARVLPTLDCTWLDLTNATRTIDGVALAFTGVAGRPADAQATISKAAADAGAPVASADFADVAPISGGECGSLDALRTIRAEGPAHLSVAQRKFEMAVLPNGQYAGKIGARAILTLDTNGLEDFALYGIEPSGAISPLVANRSDFDSIPRNGDPLADLGNGRYRLQIDADHSGWSGLILLSGKGGFRDDLLVTRAGTRTDAWRQRFADAAAAGGWKSEMVWFKTVNEVPD